MRSVSKLLSVISTSAILAAGCNSPVDKETASQKTSATSQDAASASDSKAIAIQTTPAEPTIPAVDLPPAVKSEVAKNETPNTPDRSPARSETKPKQVAQVQAAPSTTKDAIATVNLLELPRLEEKTVLQSGTTYLYYSCKGLLPEADAFYKKMLETRGFKEIPSLTPPTEQYIDRLFDKNGYCVRASLSVGSERGELGVMLANLGNVDMRLLPRLPDAEILGAPSNPVNVTFKTAKSIPDAADAVHKQLADSGWQLWNEFQETPIDVPHYRNVHYRKEACRLSVGVLTNPQNPADRTTVFYHAEFVTPFDIPTVDTAKPLKLDLTSNRASFETTSSRKDLVSLLQAHCQKFGWKLQQTDKFEAGDFHMLPIDVDSGAYLVARLVESGGNYSASLESYATAPKSKQPETETFTSTEVKSAKDNVPAPNDPTFDAIEAQVNSAIQAEITKALGSLGAPTTKPAMNLDELQAMAKGLAAKLGASDESIANEGPKNEDSNENPFDIDEDTTAPLAKYQAIKKSGGNLKHGDQSYELTHAACYVVKEYGRATKCIILSDSPIDVAKLKRLLLKEGQPIYGAYVSENANALMDLRVTESSVSLNIKAGSASMGLSSSDVQAEVSYFQGKMAGKVQTIKPIEMGRIPMEFTVMVNQEAMQVDWSKRNASEATKLVADNSKDYLVPEGCNGLSSEGSKYSKTIEATIDKPIAAVQAFYVEQLEKNGWKQIEGSSGEFKRYQSKEQELDLKLASKDGATVIQMLTRNKGAAKADSMLPPAGKAMLVLGNMSDATVQMSIAGKNYRVAPGMNADPKNATKVVVEPGTTKVQVTIEKGNRKVDMEAVVVANSTWGVMFDTSFQDVLRLY